MMNIPLSTARERYRKNSQRKLETSRILFRDAHPSFREMLLTQISLRLPFARFFAIARFGRTLEESFSSFLRFRFAREKNFSSRCRKTNRIVATGNSAKLTFRALRRRKRSTHAILSATDGRISFDRRELN